MHIGIYYPVIIMNVQNLNDLVGYGQPHFIP